MVAALAVAGVAMVAAVLTRHGRCRTPGTGECSRRVLVVDVIRRRWR
jgi:hypothetical protein